VPEATGPEASVNENGARKGFLGLSPSALMAALLGVVVVVVGVVLAQDQSLTILVVSMDTTRPDHLSAYGYEQATTPTLARLAREGAVFQSARSTTSWTLPSHMSLFTGLPPELHGVKVDFNVLDLGRKTMGEVFSAADFRTVGIYTAPYVHGRFGFDRGMDFYERATRLPMAFDLPPDAMSKQIGVRERVSHREITSARAANKASYMLAERSRPKTFMFLHFFDPHYDFLAPQKFVGEFVDPAYEGPVNGDTVTSPEGPVQPDMPAADLAHLMSLYDAEIKFVDTSLEKVIRVLEETGKIGSTIVVVVADHGEEFFERGRFGHRAGLHDEVLRIPMIFWGPGIIPEGVRIEDEVALYDVLPTLMDYADIAPDPTHYGRSLRPLMEGESLPGRPTVASLTFVYADGPDHYTRHDALVLDGMKLIRKVDVPWSREDHTYLDNPPDLSTVEIQVYDLKADPGELVDLYPLRDSDPRVAAMERAYAAETSRVQSDKVAFRPRGSPTDAFSNTDFEQFLREMGYLEAVESAGSPDGPIK
jgi:choline-sulfatase